MSNIYSFLENVWKEIQTENKQNKSFIPLLLVLITLPLSMSINNFFLMLFVFISVLYFKKDTYNLVYAIILPMILFLWMSLSYFWTIDVEKTLKAIPKEIFFFIFPFLVQLQSTMDQSFHGVCRILVPKSKFWRGRTSFFISENGAVLCFVEKYFVKIFIVYVVDSNI